MPRKPPMTREQTREQTRERLMAAARELFAKEGFGGASVGRIAQEAGYTKGAFYSNFESKEDIFLQMLEGAGIRHVSELAERLDGRSTPDAIIRATVAWANEESKESTNRLIVYETIRRAQADGTFGRRHESLFHDSWTAVGKLLEPIFSPGRSPVTALQLGALVMELVYGNAMIFHSEPTAGDLVGIALRALRANRRAPRQSTRP